MNRISIAATVLGSLFLLLSAFVRLFKGDVPLDVSLSVFVFSVVTIFAAILWLARFKRFSHLQEELPAEILAGIYGASVISRSACSNLLFESGLTIETPKRPILLWSAEGLAVYDFDTAQVAKIPTEFVHDTGFSSAGSPNKLGQLHYMVGQLYFKSLIYRVTSEGTSELLDDSQEDAVLSAFA